MEQHRTSGLSVWTLAGVLCGVGAGGLSAGCAGERPAIPRPLPGQEVDVTRARSATAQGDWRTAAVLWNELFLRGGGEERVTACVETARALGELGDHESARGVIELGLRRDPEHPWLLETQGDVLAEMGFRRAAEAAYALALESDPNRPHALLELARTRIGLGREHLALESLRKRLALGHADAETYLLRAQALVACHQPEPAYTSFVKAFELGASDPKFLVSAACLVFDGDMRASEACRVQSREWLELAVETDPQLTLAHLYLGVLREEDKDLPGALEHYERAVETDPSHAASLTRLARVLDSLGNTERASKIARKALEYEEDPGHRARLKQIARTPSDL